jgi:hypothetical protein
MFTPSTTTKRRRMLGVLLALASAVSLAGLQPGTASADTLYGPTGTPDGSIFPSTQYGFGNPTVMHLLRDGVRGGQALEVAANSSTPGAIARTWDLNYTNAQRVYFQWYTSVAIQKQPGLYSYENLYRIVHFTAAGALCLDADASHGAPGAGAIVQWVWCHDNWAGNPQQLWFATDLPRVGHPGMHKSLVNAASVTHGSVNGVGDVYDLQQPLLLTAAQVIHGLRSPLTLEPSNRAWLDNSVWEFQNMPPAPAAAPQPGQEPCTNKVECLAVGGNPDPGCDYFCWWGKALD